MDTTRDLSYFMTVEYEVILKKKGDLYCLFIPELSIVVTDEHLESAYEKLDREKERFFTSVIGLNAVDRIKMPGDKREKARLIPGRNELAQVFFKTLAASLALVLMLIIGSLFMRSFGSSIVKNVNRSLSGAINSSLYSIRDLPVEVVGNSIEVVRNKVATLYQKDIYRIRILGLITNNPAVHYKASVLKEESGNLQGAIEEMELALGLLSMHSSDNEVKQLYRNRLAALKKK